MDTGRVEVFLASSLDGAVWSATGRGTEGRLGGRRKWSVGFGEGGPG